MDDDLQQKIDAALEKGLSMSDIARHLSSHSNENYQSYGKSWIASNEAPATRKSDFQDKPTITGSITPILNTINENPKTAATVAVLAGGAYLGNKIMGGIEDRRMKREMHEIEKQKVQFEKQKAQAYTRQVELQGQARTPLSSPDALKQLESLSPVAEEISSANAVDKLQQAQQRAEAGRAAGIGQAPVQTPVQEPGPIQRQAIPQAPGAPSFMSSYPKAPVPPITTPSVTEAVVTGQNPDQALKVNLAEMIDEAPAPTAAPETKVSQRVRRTAQQIEADLAEKMAKAPEGMLPAAPRKTNKLLPSDVIGQGGWHWYQGQMGPEAETEWLRQFGRTNQSYTDVKQAVKEGRLPVPAPTDSKKGGSHLREEFVPNYIKGSASLAQLGQLAMNALGAAGLLQAFKQGQETGDYSDFGLGAAGQVLGNIAPKAGLGLSLMAPTEVAPGTVYPIPKTKKEREELYKERVGSGRGIAPVSMYQR